MEPISVFGRSVLYLERIAKTDLRYVFRGGSWLAFAQIIISVVAFLISIAFAHFVSKEVYGTYRFLLSLFWVLTALSLTGLPAVLARAVAKGDDGAYLPAIRLSLLWALPMLVISCVLAAYYFYQGNPTLGFGCLVIALVGPCMQGSYLYGSYLEGKQAFRDNAIFGILLNAVPAILLVVSMFWVTNPVFFLFINLGGSVLTAATLSIYTYLTYKPKKSEQPKGFLSLTGHFSAMNILFTLSQQLDRLLVYHYIGAAQLAVYSFAIAIPDQIKTLFGTFSTLALPKFVTRSLSEIKKTLIYRLLGFTALTVLAAVLYSAIAPYFFHAVFPNYTEAIHYSQIYAFALVPIGSMIPLTILEAHAAKKSLYIFNILGPLFQIVVLFFGILSYGLLGVVIARIIGRLFTLALSVGLVHFYTSPSHSP
jgi:O-antigen/teichoic acid export membrane protein